MDPGHKLPFRRWFPAWVLACGAGELLGIGLAALLMVMHFRIWGEPTTPAAYAGVLFMAVLAGLAEGCITGFLQWRVLRRLYAQLRPGPWIGMTAAGAATAWLIGMIPGIAIPASGAAPEIPEAPGAAMIVMMGIIMGLSLGALLGAFQWRALRKHSAEAGRWIPANAAAWALGMPLIMLAATAPDENTPIRIILLLALAGGVAAGAVLGIVTGIFLHYMPAQVVAKSH